MNFNKIFVLGNVTRDPEVRSLPSGQQVTTFGLATNRFYTAGTGEKKQETEFHNIVCFGKLADISSRYLNKGSLVLIEGRVKTRNWVNNQGIKQYRTEVIAENLQLGPKGSGSGNSSYNKPFSSPEPDTSHLASSQEIPIIQEDFAPAPEDNSSKEVSFEDQSAEEIDVKDIPF